MRGLTIALLWALAPAAALARCQWSHIQDATDAYLESQTSGKPSAMFLTDNLVYRENNRIISPKAGIINRPLAIAHQHRLVDQDDCASYVEQIVTDPKNPYVIGTQLRFNESTPGGGLTAASVDSIVTTTGDWLFNASKTLSYILKEDWGTMDAEARPDRGTLRSIANLYLDLWGNEKSRVPWGTPCDRLEGSAYTGNGSATDSCAVGIPTGPQPPVTDRRYVYDETVGAVSVLCTMGAMGNAPDSHEFRVEGGKLRYVHTMTVLRNQTARPRMSRVRRSVNVHG